MKANEVMRTLRISRSTLSNYVKRGMIKTYPLPFNRLDYDKTDVYNIINDAPRQTFIYGRVSTSKQKEDLDNQIELLKQYCFNKGYQINGIYKDIASGISFEKRKDFFEMLNLILDGRVNKVVIIYKDRLSRVGFDIFKNLFSKYDCEIEVMSEVGSEKLDGDEVFDDVVNLLQSYTLDLYSTRKNKTIKELICN